MTDDRDGGQGPDPVGGGGEPPPGPPNEFVEELITDARNVARYRRWLHLDGGDALLDAAHKATGKGVGSPEVSGLQRLVQEDGKAVPFGVLAKLRKGWNPYHPTWGNTTGTVLIVGIAVGMVLFTATCTYVYNRGVTALAELDQLIEMDARKTFGRHLRDMDQAQSQAEEALRRIDAGSDEEAPQEAATAETQEPAGAATARAESGSAAQAPRAPPASQGETAFSLPAQFDLARNVYFDGEADLAQLSQRLVEASREAQRVQHRLRGLLPSHLTPSCLRFWWFTSGEMEEQYLEGDMSYEAFESAAAGACGEAQAKDRYLLRIQAEKVRLDLEVAEAQAAASQAAASGDEDREATQAATSTSTQDEEDCRTKVEIAFPAVGYDGLNDFPEYGARLDHLWALLWCRGTVVFLPNSLPPHGFPTIAQDHAGLTTAMVPFGQLYLPALYGAIGALMTVLRSAIRPLLPNPSLSSIVHRVSLGAIAGVILIWFATPDSAFDAQRAALGLSLFGLAFLVGFSLDLFFSVFDRLVSLASTGVQSWGDGRPGAPG